MWLSPKIHANSTEWMDATANTLEALAAGEGLPCGRGQLNAQLEEIKWYQDRAAELRPSVEAWLAARVDAAANTALLRRNVRRVMWESLDGRRARV